MVDLNFSFGFQKFELPDGKHIQRPLLPVRLTHRERAVETHLLLDSGADFSMIQRPLAEDMLGIDIEACKRASTQSVGDALGVALCPIDITLEQSGRNYTMQDVLFHVPLDRPGYPVFPLIGREPLFLHFEVSFRMGYTKELGKFVLRREKSRDPQKYLVDGKPLRERGYVRRR